MLRLKRQQRIQIDAVKSVLEPLGFTVEIAAITGHMQLAITAPDGRRAKKPVSGSPRSDDVTIEHMARCDAKRIARSMGYEPSTGRRG